MKRTSASNRFGPPGFTLIEMMAVLLLVAVLLAIAVPTFVNMGRGTKFDAAIAQLRSTLSQARQWAITHRETTYVVFPDDRATLNSDPDFENMALRCYNAYTETDGYIREWSFLPPGIYFVNKDNFKGVVKSGKWVFDDDGVAIPYPESNDTLKGIPHVAFKPDGTRTGTAVPREIYIGEGFSDETGTSITFLDPSSSALFGLEVSQHTGGVRVRDYQD